jgi:hypothetical protein
VAIAPAVVKKVVLDASWGTDVTYHEFLLKSGAIIAARHYIEKILPKLKMINSELLQRKKYSSTQLRTVSGFENGSVLAVQFTKL